MLKVAGLLLLSAWCLAQSKDLDLDPHLSYEPSADPLAAPTSNGFVQTRERIVTIGGVSYREIEYRGDVFLVNAREADNVADCTNVPTPPNQFAVDAKVQIAKRTSLFMESLRQHCNPITHRVETSKNVRDTNLGIKFQGDNPGDSEKKIFINPVNRTGGAGITF